MKVYHCEQCSNHVHFENSGCVNCGSILGFDCESFQLRAFKDQPPEGYCRCANSGQGGCNWLVPVGDSTPYCFSCRLSAMVPDLDDADNLERWRRLEAAKRYFLYGVMRLGLPVVSRKQDPEHGLSFELLADQEGVPGGAVMTGHDNGLITINIAEGSDPEREARRDALDEPLRTMVGHFRHESGHYYWDLLVDRGGMAEAARKVFGDERVDYSEALKAYYASGPDENWQQNFISAYASCHPWEDFAETWAHYLHIADSYETALEYGLVEKLIGAAESPQDAFGRMIQAWVPLTVAVNAMNRGMGQPDLYPFVLTQPVIDKLQFIDKLVRHKASAQ
jgi:hypothetical protein